MGYFMRADVFLVEQGYAKSRSEAQAAIKAGLVRANGEALSKPSQTISVGAVIAYEKPHPYVSRGGVKLAAALDHFGLSPEGRICLDLGASTGGFTQVLLQRGAASVCALDVGHGQMDRSLMQDPRVSVQDGINVRDLASADLPQPVTAITADLSFISLKLALPPALFLAEPDAWAVALVKPQFEVGRQAVGKGGIVRDAVARAAVVTSMEAFIAAQPGWQVLGLIESPIAGGDGNVEYLLAARKS
jgi:23S rRNA (cytidine1920-2'-O)/16S rRNA (cytidine1409-2'-O)-methyltransferase